MRPWHLQQPKPGEYRRRVEITADTAALVTVAAPAAAAVATAAAAAAAAAAEASQSCR